MSESSWRGELPKSLSHEEEEDDMRRSMLRSSISAQQHSSESGSGNGIGAVICIVAGIFANAECANEQEHECQIGSTHFPTIKTMRELVTIFFLPHQKKPP